MTILDLIKTRETVVWLTLMALTIASWIVAVNDKLMLDNADYKGIGLIVVALFKVRLIILYFMEVRDSSAQLRYSCEGWALVSCLLLIGLYTGLLSV
ncbi:MAG: cytochrome C oxidase subunit IV family protein [Halieaceae bacterium]|nr:cytochrome C oxidase subunit IV family protein [Halieaceae bacterium]